MGEGHGPSVGGRGAPSKPRTLPPQLSAEQWVCIRNLAARGCCPSLHQHTAVRSHAALAPLPCPSPSPAPIPPTPHLHRVVLRFGPTLPACNAAPTRKWSFSQSAWRPTASARAYARAPAAPAPARQRTEPSDRSCTWLQATWHRSRRRQGRERAGG